MSSNIRYLRVSSRTLDGTTPLATSFTPPTEPTALGDRNQPYSWVDQGIVGRISPLRWLSRGSLGALVIAKCWTPSPDGPVLLTSRSPTLAELGELKPPADVPVAPGGLDQILESRNVTPTVWSTPILFSPEHALTLSQAGDAPGSFAGNTVELIFIDIGNPEVLAYLNGLLSAICCTDTNAIPIVATVTGDTTVAPFAGTQYLLTAAVDPSMTVTLPLAASVAEQTKLIVTRIGGGYVNITGQGADTINGQPTAQVVVLDDMGQATFERIGGQWISSDSPITATIVLTNVVPGDTVNLPIATGKTLVGVSSIVHGSVQLPAAADVALGVEYLIRRTTDVATDPRRVTILQAVGDVINGSSDPIYLGNVGSGIRVIRVAGGWLAVSDRQIMATQVLNFAADQALDSGTPGEKLIRAAQAALQTITLPPAAQTPAGTTYKFMALGAGGLTIADGGSPIIGGGAVATSGAIRLQPDDTAILTFDGSFWHLILSAPVVQVVVQTTDVVLAVGWTGLRVYRATQMAAQTITMPGAANCTVGMRLQVVCKGAGGLTLNGGGSNVVVGGATGVSIALITNETALLTFDGTEWQASIN